MAKYWLFLFVAPRTSSLLIRICKYSYRTAVTAVPLEEGYDNPKLAIPFFLTYFSA